MAFATGIAGSDKPEVDGIFLCPDEFTVDFFVRINNTGGPVDVWAVDHVQERELLESGSGFYYVARRVSSDDLTLKSRDLAPRNDVGEPSAPAGGAYRSTVTLTLDSGAALVDDEALDYLEHPRSHPPALAD